VEAYISRQVDKADCADPRFKDLLRQFTVSDANVNLAKATESNSGRYWYNLHLVLVAADRYRMAEPAWLGNIRDGSFKIGNKKGYAISRLSVMPDHLHVSLRGNIAESPEMIALAFLNNLAYILGQKPYWEPCYYAGTFGEYDMNAVRR